MCKREFFYLILTVLIFCSCSLRIEKRRYQKGFFIQTNTAINHKKTEPGKDGQLIERQDSSLTNDSHLISEPALSNVINETLPTQQSPDKPSSLEPMVTTTYHQTSSENKNVSNKKALIVNKCKLIFNDKIRGLKKPVISKLTKQKWKKESQEKNNLGLIIGIILLTLLALAVFIVFAVSLAYGGLNWITILLGIALIILAALIIFLLFRLIA